MNIKTTVFLVAILTFAITLFSFNYDTEKKYKCLIQMIDYDGEKAYTVISLIDPEGKYEKTLYVSGENKKWYHEITDWWKFYGKKRASLDGISGATIGGGERGVSVIEIDDTKINSGYRIRFETAVEDQEYYTKDVEFELTTESVKGQKKGKGIIRYVRIIPNS